MENITSHHGGNVVPFPIPSPDIDTFEDDLSWEYFMAFLHAMADAGSELENWRPTSIATKQRAFESAFVDFRDLLEQMAVLMEDWHRRNP